MNKSMNHMSEQEFQNQLVEPMKGMVSIFKQEKDQRHVALFPGVQAVSNEPAKERLPLFMPPLYRGKDFDPL